MSAVATRSASVIGTSPNRAGSIGGNDVYHDDGSPRSGDGALSSLPLPPLSPESSPRVSSASSRALRLTRPRFSPTLPSLGRVFHPCTTRHNAIATNERKVMNNGFLKS